MTEEDLDKLINKCKKVGTFYKTHKNDYVPITLEEYDATLDELKKTKQLLNEERQKSIKLEEKFKNKDHDYRSIKSKYQHQLRKDKNQIYEELKNEQYELLEDKIRASLEWSYKQKEEQLVRDINSRVTKEVIRNSQSVETYSKKILEEIEKAYTDYLENSNYEGERATGYLIALRKYQKISKSIIEELNHVKRI